MMSQFLVVGRHAILQGRAVLLQAKEHQIGSLHW